MSTTTLPLPLQESSLPIGSLAAYISWANKFPMLTAEQEKDLALRFHNHGDLAAARQLVLAHLRLVIHIARGYLGYGLPFADLIQEGSIGLMKAVKNFNPEMGVRLVSFATHWIKAEMHEFILRNFRIVKIATTKAQRKLFFNLRRMTRDKLNAEVNSQKHINTIATTLKVKPQDVTTMQMRLHAKDVALEPLTNNDDEDEAYQSPITYLAAPKELEPATIIEQENWSQTNNDLIKQALASLDNRSQDIISARWLKNQKTTLQQLAKKYHISIERIRQIEVQALQKLKLALTA